MSDEVGYGKPPQTSKFQKGRSGNPNGRPRKMPSSISESTKELDRALKESIKIQENGRTKRITKLRAIMKQITNKAALGDPTALRLILPHIKWRDEEIQKELRQRMRPVEELTGQELAALIRREIPLSLVKGLRHS